MSDNKLMSIYDKFTSKATIYDKYRPHYSSELIDFVYDLCNLDAESVIADIGAGTGILSEEFLKRYSNVYCIEPNIAMLEQAKQRLMGYRKAVFINSCAEDTTLPNNSVNLVTVGQAFHWFDKKQFFEECRRILVDKGLVLLTWNVSNSSSKINCAISDLNHKLLNKYRDYNSRDKENDMEYYSFFTSGDYGSYSFSNDLILNYENFIGRCLSRSYAPNSDDDNYEEYIKGLTDIFDRYSEDEKIKILNVNKAMIGSVQ